jgi:hypothetical protein
LIAGAALATFAPTGRFTDECGSWVAPTPERAVEAYERETLAFADEVEGTSESDGSNSTVIIIDGLSDAEVRALCSTEHRRRGLLAAALGVPALAPLAWFARRWTRARSSA